LTAPDVSPARLSRTSLAGKSKSTSGRGNFDAIGIFAGNHHSNCPFVLLIGRMLDVAEKRLIIWRRQPANY
jgi:hypothetical protein